MSDILRCLHAYLDIRFIYNYFYLTSLLGKKKVIRLDIFQGL